MMKKIPRLALSLYAAVFVAAYASPVVMSGSQNEVRGASLFGELAQAKQELQLTHDQERSWRAAEAATRRARVAMRNDSERLQSMMAASGQVQLPGPLNIDLQVEAAQVEGRVARDLACASWLAAYESLSDAQKSLASKHIQQAVGRAGNYAGITA